MEPLILKSFLNFSFVKVFVLKIIDFPIKSMEVERFSDELFTDFTKELMIL